MTQENLPLDLRERNQRLCENYDDVIVNDVIIGDVIVSTHTHRVRLSSGSGSCVANLRMNTTKINPNLTPLISLMFSSPKALKADAIFRSLVPSKENCHLKRGHLQIVPPSLVLKHYLERGREREQGGREREREGERERERRRERVSE